MRRKPLQPVVIAIVGSTGSGKTAFAVEIARRYPCEVIGVDSVQVYKGLDIGTAKPTDDEQKAVRHHMVDVLEAPGIMNAADFRRQAIHILEDCAQRCVPLVLLVGGTGFYLQALLRGMHPVQSVSEDIRLSVSRDLRERGLVFLYRELQGGDPEYASRLHSTDTYRISRAVEIIRAGLKTPTQARQEFVAEILPYRVFQLGLRRRKSVLREAIRARTQFMIQNGLLDEVKTFLKSGSQEWAPLKSVGYKEAREFLDGKITAHQLEDQIVHNTMQLAKRQSTWFRRDKDVIWFDPDFSTHAALMTVGEWAVGAGLGGITS